MSGPDEEHIQSIASLRSRFESLAAETQPRKAQPPTPSSSARKVPVPAASNPDPQAAASTAPSASKGSGSALVESPDLGSERPHGGTGAREKPDGGSSNGTDAAETSTDNEPPVQSVRSLLARFGGASSSSGAAESSTAARRREERQGMSDRQPEGSATISRPGDVSNAGPRAAAPAISRTSSAGTVTSITNPPQADSSAGDDLPGPQRDPASQVSQELLTVPVSEITSKGPSPPASRPHSPKPPEPDRRSKPVPKITSSPTPMSSAQPSRSVTPDSEATSLSRAPSLPARKAASASDAPTVSGRGAAPPIPGNKPSLVGMPAASATAPPGPALPTLPARSRGHTVAHPTAPQLIPPRLPVRSGTAGPPTATLPPRPTGASSLSASPSDPRLIVASPPEEEYSPPPPPMRGLRIGAYPYPDPSGYAPPVRSASVRGPNPSAVSAPPVRATSVRVPPTKKNLAKGNVDLMGDSDEEEEAGEAAAAAGLNSAAKRLLDDYPDSTNANRRPPRFVPDVRMRHTGHSHAFAVHGRHVCTGSSVVGFYDALMSEVPVYVTELRETGLEHRLKDPKVTAMCFRPAACKADEGRYLWSGTKDGHLWELDIRTGKVTDTRSFAHASPVVGIFRHKKWLVSLEESGKAHVFKVGRLENGAAAEDVSKIPVHCRTVRISDKFNFAKMVNGRLWTSAGPASRSATSSASKGPIIRIYELCEEAAMAPPKTLFTSEWTGAVTAATTMPFHPGKVFLAHEGGFISIWSEDDAACIQVRKVSASDILALEGAGNRLWAGNRQGQIHVYDIDDQPWKTTNLWTAHPDCPIQSLVLDPYSVSKAGRFTIWSQARDGLRAWDALRSVDWVDRNMTLRQTEYCDFRNVNILVCSWNIDSAKPSDLSGSVENTNFFDQLLDSVESPDIIVFGFQEVIPLTDKKLTAKTLLFGGKNKESGAGADKISHAYRQWLDKLTSAVRLAFPEEPYVKVHSESLVGLFTCAFVKSSERHNLRDISVCTVKRGIGNLYGNKGAIVLRAIMDDTSLCFINVHLAAGQSQRASRTADLSAIMEDKAILPQADDLPFVNGGDGTAISDHEVVILNGDLNYRIDQRREAVMSNIEAGELDCLLEHDQLRKEMKKNPAFRLRSFEEPYITFKPTYKYNTGTTEYDSSEKRRIPAWCDRILYSKSPRISNLHYKRYETTISDHRPISAGFSVTLKAVDSSRSNEIRKQVMAEWAQTESEMLQKMEEIYHDLL